MHQLLMMLDIMPYPPSCINCLTTLDFMPDPPSSQHFSANLETAHKGERSPAVYDNGKNGETGRVLSCEEPIEG